MYLEDSLETVDKSNQEREPLRFQRFPRSGAKVPRLQADSPLNADFSTVTSELCTPKHPSPSKENSKCPPNRTPGTATPSPSSSNDSTPKGRKAGWVVGDDASCPTANDVPHRRRAARQWNRRWPARYESRYQAGVESRSAKCSTTAAMGDSSGASITTLANVASPPSRSSIWWA